MIPLGHIATITKDRIKPRGVIEHTVYHIIHESDNEFKIEKILDELVVATMLVVWDDTRHEYHHADEMCTAGKHGRRCHHLKMVEDVVADYAKIMKENA